MTQQSYPDTQLADRWGVARCRGGDWIDVVDPATEEKIGRVAHAKTRRSRCRACGRGAGTAPEWAATSAFDALKLMRKAANLLRERADRIAWIMSREQGKPLAEAQDGRRWPAPTSSTGSPRRRAAPMARSSLAVRPASCRWRSSFRSAPWPPSRPGTSRSTRSCASCRPRLAAGCPIIVKAPEETPASPAELVRAFVDAGVPAGVVNLVYGVPAEISEYLIPHPVIRKISFTGSTPVGKHLAALAGQHMKRATMELGGHAPAIIFDDADLEKAVKVMAGSKYRNAGQVCVSPTRFLVQEGVYEKVVSKTSPRQPRR
jgi:succinate-semialdehyde dehydrogenase / glutarate-semialdehyde dehydrogenase